MKRRDWLCVALAVLSVALTIAVAAWFGRALYAGN